MGNTNRAIVRRTRAGLVALAALCLAGTAGAHPQTGSLSGSCSIDLNGDRITVISELVEYGDPIAEDTADVRIASQGAFTDDVIYPWPIPRPTA